MDCHYIIKRHGMRIVLTGSVMVLVAAVSTAWAQQSPAQQPVQNAREMVASVDDAGRAVIAAPAREAIIAEPVAARFGDQIAHTGPQAAEPEVAGVCAGAVPVDEQEAREMIVKAAVTRGVPPDFALAVVGVESNFDSTALSEKGAYGLMQLMEATAASLGVDRCKPEDNVKGGVELLFRLNEKYENPVFVLAAYNAGEPAVDDAQGIPAFPETVSYIAKVLNEFYGWPPASGATLAALPVEAAKRSGPARKRNTAPVVAAAAKAAPQWKSGFVMSFDY